MTEYNLFCYAKEYNDKDSFQQERYRVFNEVVGKERYGEILTKVRSIFKGLKLELNKNSWVDEWKKVKKEQWIELSKIPEFNQKVVENIVGFKLDLKEQKKRGRPKLTREERIKRIEEELKKLKSD